MTDYNNSNRVVYIPLILAIGIVLGMLLGYLLKQKQSAEPDKLNTLLNYIEKEYVDSVSKEQLVELTIPEMLSNLDPHSVYIPAKDVTSMNEPLEGNFDGIGIQFNIQNDTVMVVNTITGGPSERKGILAGDRIISVNDTLIAGTRITNDEVMKKLRGKRNSKVKISILRKNVSGLIDFIVVRDIIPLYSVDVSYMISDDMGYIKVSRFAKNTDEEFLHAVSDLKTNGMNKLILDLRNNSGGYMTAAINIADEFLPQGKLIVYTQGKARERSSSYATSRGICHDVKLVILIDEFSASASEILAGAIQDNDRGLIAGRRSFGKGLVQEPTYFSDGSSLRLTIARYYTPTGRSIQRPYNKGVEEYYYDIGDRYLNGETMVADTSVSDSVKYKTPGGKIVYGGGGITPDVFVPADTSGFSPYFAQITNKQLIYQFAFRYTDNNRSRLSQLKTSREMEQYLIPQNLMNQFVEYAVKNGVQKNAGDIKKSELIITTQINAYIARNILDNKGFFPIIQNIDNTVIKAIELLK